MAWDSSYVGEEADGASATSVSNDRLSVRLMVSDLTMAEPISLLVTVTPRFLPNAPCGSTATGDECVGRSPLRVTTRPLLGSRCWTVSGQIQVAAHTLIQQLSSRRSGYGCTGLRPRV